MRLALVTNAASGRGTDSEAVAALLRRAGATVSVHAFDAARDRAAQPASASVSAPAEAGGGPDHRPEDAVEAAAREAVAGAPDRLAVAGGDGSIGPVAVIAAAGRLPLAVVPTGTANDFARAMDIPLDLEPACTLAARGERLRRIDLLRAGDRPFLNAASVGLSVIAARRARPFKRPLGPLAYALGGLRAGLTATPIGCRVAVDGRELFAGRAWQVIVAGTGAFGGGSELDDADPSDRLVDVAVVVAGSRLALLRRAYGMRRGGLTAQRGVRHGRGRVVDLELPSDTPFNVDGEVCAVAPLRFEARGERLDVVTP